MTPSFPRTSMLSNLLSGMRDAAIVSALTLSICTAAAGSWTASSLYAEAPAPVKPDRVLLIQMRDRVELPANLFLPKQSSLEKFPCVLVRHPLGREHLDPAWLEYVRDGYALVIQSTRSCCDTSGKMVPYLSDGWLDNQQPADGYDTVQWISSADFCDGRVSTIGLSATGITQFLLAPASPPNLRCQVIEMAPPSMYQYAIYPGGAFKKEQVEGWLKVHKRDQSVVEWIRGKNRYDTFWSSFNALDFADQIRIPQLHIGGWHDIFLQGTIDAYVAGRELSHPAVREQHRLIIGPWGHRWRHSNMLSDRVLTDHEKTAPVNITPKAWLDFHVKGIRNQVAEAPKVQYYVMGAFDGTKTKGGIWRKSETWPPKGAEYKKFVFQSNNRLVEQEDPGCNTDGQYKIYFSWHDPVPTIGGRNLFLPDGPKDISSIFSRDDVLVLATDPLKEDLEVTGRLWANIHVTDIARERDLCLRLVDISPNGAAHIISEGVAHVVPKNLDENRSSLLVQSEPRLVIVDLWSTSQVFAKGHKIGLVVGASNYPAYDISGSPEDNKSIAFKIHSSIKHPSSLSLPIMESTN